MHYCVTDKDLEGLKVRVTNYQIRAVGPLNLEIKGQCKLTHNEKNIYKAGLLSL